ncbi:type II-A CRISPR-associated protein Csn2 [Holdemanella sp. SCCA2]|nr:type II-A CRISPR-associated protein Csn2 [Holdemanella sp. SCCA2]
MKIKINYLENIIQLNDEKVLSIEIENKNYFYRLISNLYSIINSEIVEEITVYDNEDKELNISNKAKIFINFFNFEFDSKKYTNDINKYIINEMDENDKINLLKSYNKLIETFIKILNKSDLPLQILEDITVDNIIKNLKLTINSKNSLLDNLMLLIELEKTLKTNNLLIFVNLKQYLTNQELIELYKYSIYNKIKILIIDSQSYGGTLDYENKLIIDSNLDEFMLQ